MVCCLAHMCTHPLVRAQLTLATATDNLLLIVTLGESLGGHRALEAFMLRVPRPVHKVTRLRTLSCWQHQDMPSWPVLAQLLYCHSQAARRVHMIADPAATTPHPAINEGNGHALYCSGGHAS